MIDLVRFLQVLHDNAIFKVLLATPRFVITIYLYVFICDLEVWSSSLPSVENARIGVPIPYRGVRGNSLSTGILRRHFSIVSSIDPDRSTLLNRGLLHETASVLTDCDVFQLGVKAALDANLSEFPGISRSQRLFLQPDALAQLVRFRVDATSSSTNFLSSKYA